MMTLVPYLMLSLASVSLTGSENNNQWQLATADTRITIRVEQNSIRVMDLANPGSPHNWLAEGVVVPLMSKVWVAEREYPVKWVFEAASSRGPEMLILSFTNQEPSLRLSSIWQARPGHGPVEHWLEIENRFGQRVTISQQDSLSVRGVHPGDPAEVWWIKRGAANASTQGGTFEEPVTSALNLNLISNCEDGSSPVPWMAIQVGNQRGLYVGWEFSGLGRIRARTGTQAGSIDIDVGLNPDFKTDVEPGEKFLVPPAFVGCYSGDVDEGSYCLHRFILDHLRPSVPRDYPDPSLNYAIYLDAGGPTAARTADLLRVARLAHDLGLEVFMPDAMWFPACGDWRWDPARFPDGIRPIVEYVHGAGMKMGLWCAWTNGGVSEHPDALSVRGPVGHPDWFSADYKPDWKPGPFFGARLCLACAEAREWAIKKTQWLVSNDHLDYLKHDVGPIVTQCNKNSHRHHYGVDTSYWAAMGYYQVQEQLRQAHPHIVLENCSGAGHIKDFGVISRTHYTATTDTLSNLPDRQSFYDSTFALPPMILQAYTYDMLYNARGDERGPFFWRSGMMGAWQLAPAASAKWTDEEKESARRATEIYKQWIRPMLKDVKVHHVLPRPDGVRWDGLFYWSESLKRGTLYVFRPNAPEAERTVKLKGLDREAQYLVWCEDGSITPGPRAGSSLMDEGLTIRLPRTYTSDLIYIQHTSLDKPAGMEMPGDFRLDNAKTQSDPFAASAVLAWQPSDHARGYQVAVSDSADFNKTLATMDVIRPSTSLSGLAPGRRFYWKVEAVGWAGRRGSAGEPGVFTTPQLKALPGVTFASDLPWRKATAGADNTVRRDETYNDRLLSIKGREYPKGIWTHAFNDATPADVVIDISGRKFATFVADVGLDDAAGAGSVQFQVLVDGRTKAESPVMRRGAVHAFHVDVAKAKEMTLRVLNGGDGYSCDHAAWGLARFIAMGAQDPLASAK